MKHAFASRREDGCHYDDIYDDIDREAEPYCEKLLPFRKKGKCFRQRLGALGLRTEGLDSSGGLAENPRRGASSWARGWIFGKRGCRPLCQGWYRTDY